MFINSISASRKKVFQHCKYKYVLTYCTFQCKKCKKIVYNVEFIVPKQCPYCQSDNIKKFDMGSNFGAEHGTALHWVLECYANAIRRKLEDGTKLSPTDIKWMINWEKNVEEIYHKGPKFKDGDAKYSLLDFRKPNDDPKELPKQSYELVKTYLDRSKDIYQKSKIIGVESEFNIDLGNTDIHGTPMSVIGFMDYVYKEDDETLVMVDYKFGKHVQNYEEVYEDVQSRIYSMALRHKYPGYKDYLLTFDYMRGKPITVTYTPEDDTKTKEFLVQTWNEIAAPQTVSRNISWQCNAMCIGKDKCNKLWEDFKERFSNG